MATSKCSPSFYCIFLLSVLLSAENMVPKIDAKSCHEGYPWIKISQCHGERAGPPCLTECQRRRGSEAWAICKSYAGVPGIFCECWWHC